MLRARRCSWLFVAAGLMDTGGMGSGEFSLQPKTKSRINTANGKSKEYLAVENI
jgi:hypothetical protein